jgi:hypothetical protein
MLSIGLVAYVVEVQQPTGAEGQPPVGEEAQQQVTGE